MVFSDWLQLAVVIASVVVSVALGLGPWVLMVHAKLATIAETVKQLAEKLTDYLALHREEHNRIWAKFEANDVHFQKLYERTVIIEERIKRIVEG